MTEVCIPTFQDRLAGYSRFQLDRVRNVASKTLYGLASLKEECPKSLASINRSHLMRFWQMEGFMRAAQARFFAELLDDNRQIKEICEIGFNGGHSAAVFLGARPNTFLTSFDLGEHDYFYPAAQRVAQMHPSRFLLHIGDSKQTVPNFAKQQPGQKFDLIFIDGGHDFNTARSDLANTRRLANQDTVVVLDDYMPEVAWGKGPAEAWDIAVRAGLIEQQAVMTGGDHSWAVGRYLHTQQ